MHLVQASYGDSLKDAKTEANADISQVIKAIQANFLPNKSDRRFPINPKLQ